MTYKNIKKILKEQIDNNVKTFWTFNETNMEFVQIYKNYDSKLIIYTPKQLYDYLTEIENEISV